MISYCKHPFGKSVSGLWVTLFILRCLNHILSKILIWYKFILEHPCLDLLHIEVIDFKATYHFGNWQGISCWWMKQHVPMAALAWYVSLIKGDGNSWNFCWGERFFLILLGVVFLCSNKKMVEIDEGLAQNHFPILKFLSSEVFLLREPVKDNYYFLSVKIFLVNLQLLP